MGQRQQRWRGGLLATLVLDGLGATAAGVLAFRSLGGVPVAGVPAAVLPMAAPSSHPRDARRSPTQASAAAVPAYLQRERPTLAALVTAFIGTAVAPRLLTIEEALAACSSRSLEGTALTPGRRLVRTATVAGAKSVGSRCEIPEARGPQSPQPV